MPYEARILLLEKLHKELDDEIDKMERNHPHVEEYRVHELKKKRLACRDELSRLRKLQWVEEHERIELDDDR